KGEDEINSNNSNNVMIIISNEANAEKMFFLIAIAVLYNSLCIVHHIHENKVLSCLGRSI
ncbi:MAG: hypothetical protein ACJ704_06530, partial [Nitrososphaeraceae archaeon]